MGIRAAVGHHTGGVRCLGCGATVPDDVGPIHAYMTAAPGCWARYCSLEEWKSSLTGAASIGIVQDLVDSFGVQHTTSADRRNTQSVAVHLISLCAGLERGVTGRERRRLIGRWVGRGYPVLDPAPGAFGVTISDVAAAPVTERPSVVGQLAATSWSAWSAHHDTVRALLDSLPDAG